MACRCAAQDLPIISDPHPNPLAAEFCDKPFFSILDQLSTFVYLIPKAVGYDAFAIFNENLVENFYPSAK